ncbi:ethylene-responsive transcription factor RAP2-3-like [Panicum miliaceum]|uniref:Ethylene-responsive transcription factor RAP2-3-like n=1 Tax=Panicum miliaceum TaxID=4540 RepID=A0A3L6TIK9_PANMI|nr:ethylene-responsive transcription factor RAP2-3-like [Panicum miliaceum]
MCGGAILAELIPSPRRAASKPETAGHLWPAGSDSKKAGSGRNKRHQLADVDDFEAAFEDFEDDFDEEEIAVKPEIEAAFDVGSFFDMTFPAFPAAPPAMESSFTGSTGSESGSPAKKPRYDNDSSDGMSSGGGSALELADELAYDPFMMLQLPYSGGYDSLDGLFGVDAAQDVNGVNNDMNGVSLWSFDEFPADSAVF